MTRLKRLAVLLALCLFVACNVQPGKIIARWTLDWEPAATTETAIGLGAEG